MHPRINIKGAIIGLMITTSFYTFLVYLITVTIFNSSAPTWFIFFDMLGGVISGAAGFIGGEKWL